MHWTNNLSLFCKDKKLPTSLCSCCSFSCTFQIKLKGSKMEKKKHGVEVISFSCIKEMYSFVCSFYLPRCITPWKKVHLNLHWNLTHLAPPLYPGIRSSLPPSCLNFCQSWRHLADGETFTDEKRKGEQRFLHQCYSIFHFNIHSDINNIAHFYKLSLYSNWHRKYVYFINSNIKILPRSAIF